MAIDLSGLSDPEARLLRARRNSVREPVSWLERLLPLNFNAWREDRMAFDAIITGHNPVLAAILLKQALSFGFRCLVTLEGGDDGWPYDLSTHPHAVDLLASALGLKAQRYGRRERFFPGMVDEFIAPECGNVTVLSPGFTVRTLARQHDGEVSLAVDGARSIPSSPQRDLLSATLAHAVFRSPRVSPRKNGKLFVFSRRAIPTGLADGFAPGKSDGTAITYDNRHVYPVGTAAFSPACDTDRARMMVDDIVRCARFEF
jgi:hypothetical protein